MRVGNAGLLRLPEQMGDFGQLTRPCAAGACLATSVYNYWEPLHFLLKGDAFRTWEYSSEYAIRSWAYIALHVIPAKIFSHLNASEKVRLESFAIPKLRF